MQPRTQRLLTTLAGIAFSCLFVYLCWHKLHDQSLRDIFHIPRPWLLAAAVAINFAFMALRTQLWAFLLRPLRRLPFWPLFDIFHIGSMLNNLLPLKAGEFFRGSFVSKKWKLPYSQVLTTVGLEKYFTGATLIVLLLGITYFIRLPAWIKSGTYTMAGILLASQLGLGLLWKKQAAIRRWEKRHPVLDRIVEFLFHVHEGSQVLRSPRLLCAGMGYAVLIWLSQAAMLYAVEGAMGVRSGFGGTLMVIAAINLAIALPSAPSNLGAFELATVLAYEALQVERSRAMGIALYFHFLQLIPVTLLGLFYYFRWGVRMRDLKKHQEKTEFRS